MPSSLLTLPYELREQILTDVLYHKDSIKLQYPGEHPDVFTPPITQVCKWLREEAVRVFYHINTFLWTIDPEAVSLETEILVRMHLFCLTSAIVARIYGSNEVSFVWLLAKRKALRCTIVSDIYATLAMHEPHAETSSIETQLVSPKPLQHEALGRYAIEAACRFPPSHRRREKAERSEDLDRDLVPFPWHHR